MRMVCSEWLSCRATISGASSGRMARTVTALPSRSRNGAVYWSGYGWLVISPSGAASGVDELVLVRPHRQHRARRPPHHLIGDAAQQDMRQPRVAVRADDDQVHVALAREADDLLVGRALDDL